ncbi:uncharacterized protein V1516DRAFT_663696 [Lipomyces oligophaga]|uniref:uncharacterized protein n=1 Tax=Lipomyces oligophaga TaxID=45792 RepID=UPI0034CE16C7
MELFGPSKSAKDSVDSFRFHSSEYHTAFVMNRDAYNSQQRRRVDKLPRSRSGCITCRARHKRCDQRLPHCKNCEILQIKCQGYERTLRWQEKAMVKAEVEPTKYTRLVYLNVNPYRFEESLEYLMEKYSPFDVYHEPGETQQTPLDPIQTGFHLWSTFEVENDDSSARSAETETETERTSLDIASPSTPHEYSGYERISPMDHIATSYNISEHHQIEHGMEHHLPILLPEDYTSVHHSADQEQEMISDMYSFEPGLDLNFQYWPMDNMSLSGPRSSFSS